MHRMEAQGAGHISHKIVTFNQELCLLKSQTEPKSIVGYRASIHTPDPNINLPVALPTNVSAPRFNSLYLFYPFSNQGRPYYDRTAIEGLYNQIGI
jgi:hypothetical protein